MDTNSSTHSILRLKIIAVKSPTPNFRPLISFSRECGFVFSAQFLFSVDSCMMACRVRTYETDHPYALQSWEGRFPQLIPGDGSNDVLRVRAPKAYWLSLELNFPDYHNEEGFAPIDVLKRDLNGTNGCPPLGESFKTRVKKTIG